MTSFGPDFLWLLNRPPAATAWSLDQVPSSAVPDDEQLVSRVVEAYRTASAEYSGSSSLWDDALRLIKGEIHDALMTGSKHRAAAVLRDPASNTMFWGFDAIAAAPPGTTEPHELVMRTVDEGTDWATSYAAWIMDGLNNLAVATGALRAYNPEAGLALDQSSGAPRDPDGILDAIEAKLGMVLDIPNPFPGERGIRSGRGIIGFRTVQAIYQAWRIAGLAQDKPSFRVLEIGAGLGRTAYYATRMGVTDYTILDIPLTNAAQAYFLGRTLGPGHIRLHGEDQAGTAVKIVPAHALETLRGRFDLVVNVDSMTELSAQMAASYYGFAKRRAGMLLSVNHELNGLTVLSLHEKDNDAVVCRHPCWMRRGYVEETVVWPHPVMKAAREVTLPTREEEDAAILAASGLIDSVWYLDRNKDVAASGRDALDHYIRYGAAEGRDPNPLFDTSWYLARSPEAAASGENPLVHYLAGGAAEGLDPHPMFDSAWYLAHNPDVVASGMNPLVHYVRYGGREGRSPHPLFDASWYLATYADVAANGLDPLTHFVLYGAAEGRNPRPHLDTSNTARHLQDPGLAAATPSDRPGGPAALRDLFFAHDSKVVDKWEHYLSIYDVELAPFRERGRPVRLLEIGVQNGGSLEVWSRYLPANSVIRGIDVDPKVGSLRFPGTNIVAFVADATDPAAIARLIQDQTFDVVIDDGSHRSSHIIASFRILFRYLAPGGRYMIEDLHASYWPALEGGYRAGHSAIEWLKTLIDVVNADHIPDQVSVSEDDREIVAELKAWLARISFYDSFAVIEKLSVEKSEPYRHIISGHDADVVTSDEFLSHVPARTLQPMLFGPMAARRLNQKLVVALDASQTALNQSQVELDALQKEREYLRAVLRAMDPQYRRTLEAALARRETLEASAPDREKPKHIVPPFSCRPAFDPFPIDRFAFGTGRIGPTLDGILDRIRDDTNWADDDRTPRGDSLWSQFGRDCSGYIDVFSSGSRADAHLVVSTLFASALTHGFQQGHVIQGALRTSEPRRLRYAAMILDRLVRLAEALGIINVMSAEHGQTTRQVGDLAGLLQRIEDHVGFDLGAPSVDGALFGIELPNGIYTDRHFDGIYAAWRLKQLSKSMQIDEPAICEIGGGAGYVAYYAWKMGLRNYTIIDLPAANIVQAILLASSFGVENTRIGQQITTGTEAVSIFRDSDIQALDFQQFDIVVNVDSLPEMPHSAASNYVARIAASKAFLSINQESETTNGKERQGIVRELCTQAGMHRVYRYPSWLRTGYVEELFQPPPVSA